jgi:squalene synthase HpnC
MAMATTTQAQFANDQLLAAGWAALPAAYRMPATTPSLEEARAYCKHLTETHYENFTVASWFLPERLRPHFNSIYAYCRISDDLGDEVGDTQQSLALLEDWGRQLDDCYAGVARHPVFVALSETIRICDIPRKPFADLLVAFRQDQTVTRYDTREQLLSYCENSANPVGRLVLYACGYRDAARFALSDHTCTALQLANFWQDVSVDWKKDRVYIPQEDLRQFGLTDTTIERGIADNNFRALIKDEVQWTRNLFAQGMPLVSMVDNELALDLDLFTRGGLEILSAIEKQNYDVLKSRPSLSKSRKVSLMLRALATKFVPGMSLGAGKQA